MRGKELVEILQKEYPIERMESWDNCGFLVGDLEKQVKKILLTLDITKEIIEEGIKKEVDLIITHHPIIFHPLKQVLSHSLVGQLLKKDIGVLSFHTNLDIAKDGVNETLAKKIGLKEIIPFPEEISSHQFLLQGKIDPCSSSAFCDKVKKALNCERLKVSLVEKEINTVALCSGGGGSFTPQAIQQGVDAYISGDISYDKFCLANQENLLLIDAGHFETETVVLEALERKISQLFPQINVEIGEENKNQGQYR